VSFDAIVLDEIGDFFKLCRMKISSKVLTAVLLAFFALSCSHHYEGDTLDLGFYQWNMWVEEGKTAQGPEDGIPSCGWEEFNRGKGILVRIPALAGEHFPEAGEQSVLWYHCRFSLPKQWDQRPIRLEFEGVSHLPAVWLNEKALDLVFTGGMSYEADVSGSIYYTRDNHLSVRISGPGPGPRGITGDITVVSTPPSATNPGP